jgi:hypothetical protein
MLYLSKTSIMEITYRQELETEFLKQKIYLDEEKEKRSHEEFKQLIIETWIGFSSNTIDQLTKRYKLTEFELADLHLLYDKRFEGYYEKSINEKAFSMVEVIV